MRAILGACALATAAVLVQDLLPGRAFYHAGWFNVGIIAVIGYAVLRLRKISAARSCEQSAT